MHTLGMYSNFCFYGENSMIKSVKMAVSGNGKLTKSFLPILPSWLSPKFRFILSCAARNNTIVLPTPFPVSILSCLPYSFLDGKKTKMIPFH